MPDEAPSGEHELVGFEPDNLLAFLALLGTLHALEAAAPQWRPRVSWSLSAPRVRPRLTTITKVKRAELLDRLNAGIVERARCYEFGGRADPATAQDEARAYLLEARTASHASVAAALSSDVTLKPDGKLEATPLCTLFGQGHQHLLTRLRDVPLTAAPPKRGRGRDAIELSAADSLSEALFDSWRRIDQTQSFRWDVAEDVRYAHRYANPSNSATKAGTQHAANRLAAIGFETLPAVPFNMNRGAPRMLARSTRRTRGGVLFRWPVWDRPTSLAGVLAMLDSQERSWPSMDVRWFESRRFSQGKFLNWSQGQKVPAGS